MKKLLYIFACLIVISGCKKTPETPTEIKQDVVFRGDYVSGGTGLKSDGCDNPTASYAHVVVNGIAYKPAVVYLNEIPFTQAIKLSPGSYSLEEFLLMNDAGTPVYLEDDIIVQAIPTENAPYANFIEYSVPIDFVVSEFAKTEVPIEVMCFNENDFEEFGFIWFLMNEITVRNQFFYGEFYVPDPDDYAGSLYENLDGGLQKNMPAIFRIDVYRNDAFIISYTNEDQLPDKMKVKVSYPDHDNSADQFTFKLFNLVKGCGGFEYKYIDEWTFNDNEKLEKGTDNAVDFIIGNRNNNEMDYEFPAYQTLPDECNIKIKTYLLGSELGTFVDLSLSLIPEGFTLDNGTYPGWNGNHLVIDYENLFEDESVEAEVYSSLCQDDLPESICYENKNWEAVNWLINNLDNYPAYEWADLQAAFWLLLDKNPEWDGSSLAGVADLSELTWAQQMHDDAIDNSQNYLPDDDELAAVIFLIEDDLKDNQVKLNFSFFEVSNVK